MVTAAGRTHLTILFDNGGYVHVKKSAYPSLKEDMRIVVTMTVAKAAKQPRLSPEDVERRRRSRWVTREAFRRVRRGEPPNILDLMRRSHLQPVEEDE